MSLNILEWCHRLHDYPKSLCDFLEFGWPVGYTSSTLSVQTAHNHGSARSNPTVIDDFLSHECELGTTCGPFFTNPLSVDISISPLQIVYSRTGKPRIVVDLSYPPGHSVNCGILRDTYLGEPFSLCLPGLDALLDIICQKGQPSHVFKKDLSRAYRQLRIDPCDYHLLGYQHRDYQHFDIAPPFGLCSSAMMCETTTSAVTYMYKKLGYSCTNCIDDFGGAETPTKSAATFLVLEDLLRDPGLITSPEKDSPPATSMVFLCVLVDTTAMTIAVTSDRLSELHSCCKSLLSVMHVSRCDLQSLLGVMSFVTSCVRPARVFMSSLLYTLRSYQLSNTARFQVLTTLICAGGVTSYRTTMVSRSLRLHLGLTTACSSLPTHAAPALGAISMASTFTPFPCPILRQFGHDINILELSTIMVTLKLWGKLLGGKRVILECDNENSVLAINSGRSRIPGMHLCSQEIWFLTARDDINIFAWHVAGVDNSIADQLSRWHLSPVHHTRFATLTADTPTEYVLCSPHSFQFEIEC